MTLCTDDLQTTGSLRIVIQLNIGSSTGHVGGDGNRSVLSCLCDDLSLLLVELRVQYGVLNSLTLEHTAQQLRSLDGDRTYQYRLTFGMRRLYLFHNRTEFFLLGLIYRILMIHTRNRTVGWNLNNVHAVNVTELLLLSESRTGHTCLLLELVKEVLESDGC